MKQAYFFRISKRSIKMKSGRILFLALAMLVLSALACQIGGTGTPPAGGEDTVATVVAATLAAIGESEGPGEDAIPTEIVPTLATVSPATPIPTATPDTLKIAYIADGNLFLWQEGVGVTPLTSTSSPNYSQVVFSDDGRWLAYVSEGALWVLLLDELPAVPKKLVNSDELHTLRTEYTDEFPAGATDLQIDQIIWRPGTHQIYYNTILIYPGMGRAPVPTNDLHMIDVDTHEKRRLLNVHQGGEITFSPNGNLFAAVQENRIAIFQADASTHWDALTYPTITTFSGYSAYIPSIKWAADSTSLRVIIPPENPDTLSPQPTTVWSIPADGTPAVNLGEFFAKPFAYVENAWSDDLQYFAYIAGDESTSALHIASANLDFDVTVGTVTPQAIYFLGWSPDNDHFLYNVQPPGSDSGLYLGQRSTLETTPVSGNTSIQMHWVDDSRFWYTQYIGGSMILSLHNSGSATTETVFSGAANLGPVTSHP
jgi:hypothetical protein